MDPKRQQGIKIQIKVLWVTDPGSDFDRSHCVVTSSLSRKKQKDTRGDGPRVSPNDHHFHVDPRDRKVQWKRTTIDHMCWIKHSPTSCRAYKIFNYAFLYLRSTNSRAVNFRKGNSGAMTAVIFLCLHSGYIKDNKFEMEHKRDSVLIYFSGKKKAVIKIEIKKEWEIVNQTP